MKCLSRLLIAAAVLSVWLLIFVWAPVEQTQGVVQKIFYLHLALVSGMYSALFAGLCFAAIYLFSKQTWSDALSLAAVEVGYLFTTGVLFSGSVWAKPIWGVWWTWDARLTTTLLIWLIYSAYLLVRYQFGSTKQGRLWTAVLAIIGFLDVPLIHYSVTLFRGVHPKVISEGGIAAPMWVVLIFSIVAMLALASELIYLRFKIESLATSCAELQTPELG